MIVVVVVIDIDVDVDVNIDVGVVVNVDVDVDIVDMYTVVVGVVLRRTGGWHSGHVTAPFD